MIEQKLIVGRYIELNTPPPTNAGYAAPHGFRPLNRLILHIDQSESQAKPVTPNNPQPGFNPTFPKKVHIFAQQTGEKVLSQFDRQRTSATGVGALAKIHRNFLWQEWVPGVVSEVEMNGMDVLTGPMSGCWIMSYLRNGNTYVGHVGTDMDSTTANSIAAKAAWNAYALAAAPGSFTGFNPFNDPWVGPVPQQLPGESTRKTFALVTSANSFHTIICYPQTHKPNRIRIAGIQPNVSTLAANGQI